MSEAKEPARSETKGRTATDALQAFAGAFVDEMARCGVRHVCVCPGSRSTPLALLLRRHPSIKVWMHLDERSAAFFALGMAKARREPVAVVATSGTAAANFAPAVAEACFGRVPLLVLTADRPPELRDVGALQTVDQVRLYGTHVKWFQEMLIPEASEQAIRHARVVAARAVDMAKSGRPGPVHINFPFREPLIPSTDAAPEAGPGADRPYVSVTSAPQSPDPADLAPLAADLRTARRGLVVCGPQDDPCFPAAAAGLAGELAWPLLADVLSQARRGGQHTACIVDSYDAFLRDAALADQLAPDVVLRFGATPVSKPLQQYFQRHAAARQIVVDAGDGWTDQSLIASDVFHADPRRFCEALSAALRAPLTTGEGSAPGQDISWWRERWSRLDRQARRVLNERLEARTEVSEPRVFTELARLLPPGAVVFAGNSMPVRDLDTFVPSGERPARFLANRGASGIDGVTSTALGVSAVSDDPVVLVIGDLSFYHDMNGLLAARLHGLRMTIVLINNDGGGIFSFLPQAQQADHFEELFGTPHGLDFRAAANLYGLDYRPARTWEDFRSAVRHGLESPGVTLVEVRTDRAANVAFHREVFAAVSEAVRAVEGEAQP